MDVPTLLDTYIDSNGVSWYTVQDSSGATYDVTQQQYEYMVASAEARAELDKAQQEESVKTSEPAQAIAESPDLREGYVAVEELPFEGSLTAYDDAAADTPALYANLPDVSNSFTAIMDWFGDTFFIERTETVHKSGYTSERYAYNSSTQLIQLPYEEDSTTTSQVLNPQACVSALLVVLVFITTVTWIKNAIWGRMS